MAITGIGNRIYRVFDVAAIPVNNTYTLPTISETCCEKFYVLAESTITDPLKNDSSDWIWFYDKSVTGVVLLLQQWVNGAWSSVATLTDDTYGTYYDGVVFQGYRFDAYKIWLASGYGSYSFIMRSYNSFGTLIETEASRTVGSLNTGIVVRIVERCFAVCGAEFVWNISTILCFAL